LFVYFFGHYSFVYGFCGAKDSNTFGELRNLSTFKSINAAWLLRPEEVGASLCLCTQTGTLIT
jgi:hypothetical protein